MFEPTEKLQNNFRLHVWGKRQIYLKDELNSTDKKVDRQQLILQDEFLLCSELLGLV